MSDALLQLFDDLVRVETALWNRLDADLRRDHGIPLSQLEPLQVIARTPRARVQDVADALAITIGGASKLVARIEAAGWCEREADPADGRSRTLAVTPRGQELLGRATATLRAGLERAIGAELTPESVSHMAALFRRLRSALDVPTAAHPGKDTK